MELYKKPLIVHNKSINGIFPLAGLALGPIAAAAGVAAKVALGGAALAGVAMGLRKGSNFIDSSRTQILTARKDFSLA